MRRFCSGRRNHLLAKHELRSDETLDCSNISALFLVSHGYPSASISLLTFFCRIFLTSRKVKTVWSLSKCELPKCFNHVRMKRSARQWVLVLQADMQCMAKEEERNRREKAELILNSEASLSFHVPGCLSAMGLLSQLSLALGRWWKLKGIHSTNNC